MSAARSQSEQPIQTFDRGRALGRLKATRSEGEQAEAIADIIGEAVDETNSNYEAIKAWWKQIDERLSEHDKRFDDHDKRFDDIDKRFDDHDKRFDDIDRELDGIKKQLSELLAMGGIFAQNPDAHECKIGTLGVGPNGGAFGLCSGCGWQRVGKAQADLEPLHRAHVEEVRLVVADS